jgi:hypothetical protein
MARCLVKYRGKLMFHFYLTSVVLQRKQIVVQTFGVTHCMKESPRVINSRSGGKEIPHVL